MPLGKNGDIIYFVDYVKSLYTCRISVIYDLWGGLMIDPGIDTLEQRSRVTSLKEAMLTEERFVSIEQARIVTDVYRANPSLPRNLLRALALTESLAGIDISITPGELIVGNRTGGVRAGVISPESGLRWVDRELENLPARPSDNFRIRREDIKEFRRDILPFWKGRTLEDKLDEIMGEEMAAIEKVVKINQTDYSQCHISPNTAGWLKLGPAKLREIALEKEAAIPEKAYFYEGIAIAMDGVLIFIRRYADLARKMAASADDPRELLEVARICDKLSSEPPDTFHEAIQSVWFLYVVLHMESNASSFSPGRIDQYLYPYYLGDIHDGRLTVANALELVECLFLKFNQIVYMRSSLCTGYFAGFPIGFNLAVGGQDFIGEDATNELSYIMLRAQEHLLLPQPNISARLHKKSPEHFITRCAQVISKGSGVPHIFNDETAIPTMRNNGFSPADARNYAITNCFELTTMGNNLGKSDAAMFNIVKVLELALNDGRCTLTGKQLGAQTGTLEDFESIEDVEHALESQIEFFFDRMICCCEIVERAHSELMPSPFLSSVVDYCMELGVDVNAGGANYNFSGIQAIQCTNIANCLAALKTLVFDEKSVDKYALYAALISNFEDAEPLRLFMLNNAPKYGANVAWVDELAHKWAALFSGKLSRYINTRGGPYYMGFYSLSAHVPLGVDVGATPDGRKAGQPLSDGGISPIYSREAQGSTAAVSAVNRSAAWAKSGRNSNGALLIIEFLPQLLQSNAAIDIIANLLHTFVDLRIIQAQFGVIEDDNLLTPQQQYPEFYQNLMIRVAGYSAYFTELAPEIQHEIIERVWLSLQGSAISLSNPV